ncbi:methylenetetrahydrofolate reductase C-terminal domain-containing protein [Baekduia sp. Peel2402]|uniref:methylenetetrahydrofolate reductase C-terminal domain-containing protein n=1 Tax=Baekduia sp. Peel2402 TaxID=3458296 RepID=UPI00403EBE61
MSACPKMMVHGPCGGVQPDGACEIGGRRCVFLADPSGPLSQRIPAPERAPFSLGARELIALWDRRPIITVELTAAPLDVDALRASAAAVAGHADAALLGDAPWARVQLPPSLRAQVVASEGVRPWASLSCRDRNRVALEGDLAGLAAVGVPAVHCVTGDHPLLGHRPDATPVFDLDSTRLSSLAAESGMLVSVAESPSAPPKALRPARMAAKAAAGAHVCFVNHAAEPGEVEEFVGALRELTPGVRCIASVPLVVSEKGVERLASFIPGAVVPVGALQATISGDPVGGAVRVAVERAEALLEVDGVDGIDLSAAAGPGEELQVAGALALAASALGGGSAA